jgi:hypothetical protein
MWVADGVTFNSESYRWSVDRRTDEGQEMEITPLLTSAENGGRRDVLWKIFLGLCDGTDWGPR